VRRLASIVAFAMLALPGTCFAGTPKDYAYVFIQGRIADAQERRALGGATVRLTADTGVFEAVTDQKGVFVFEKLPVATFGLEIVTEDGKLVSWFQDTKSSDPERPRVKLKFGSKRGKSTVSVVAKPAEERVEVVVKSPPVRWGKFWKEFAIFAGVAAVLVAH
jgi:hypothetical protein